MKGEEEQCLVTNKLKEGKDFPQINKELKNLKQSQIIFKKQKSEIKIKDDRIKVLEKENSVLKNHNFKLRHEKNVRKESERNELKKEDGGDIRSLKRLIMMVRENKSPMTLSDIRHQCFTDKKKTLSCLGFLEENNLIKSSKDGNGITRWLI